MNNKQLAIGVIAFILGAGIGFLSADSRHSHDDMSNTQSHDQVIMDPGTNSSHSEEDAAHSHAMLEVEAANAPEVSMEVTKDGKSGWNIILATQNFTFSPVNVNKNHIDGQGHAHLYVNDKKITRLYANAYYYDGELAKGDVVRITLNTNDHQEYAVDGEHIEAEYIVQ